MRTLRHSVTEALVLRRRSVGETDRSVLLFTKNYGIIWATARGVRNVRSRRSAHLEPFNITIVTLHENGSFYSITDATAVSMFGIQTTSFLKMRAYYLLSEIIERIIPGSVPHKEAYRQTALMFSDVYKADEKDVPAIMEKYLTRMLIHLGYISEETKKSLKELLRTIESIIEKKLRTIGAFRSTSS